MLKDIFRNYKKILLLFLILLGAIQLWVFACHDQSVEDSEPVAWKEESYAQGSGTRYGFSCRELAGTVVFGVKGVIPPGRTSPVCIHAVSTGDDFKGTVRITLPADEGKGVVYRSVLSCKKGEMIDKTVSIPELGSSSCFSFELLDSYGTVLLSEVLVPDWVKKEESNQVIYLGVLSENFRRLSFLNGTFLGEDETGSTLRLIDCRADDFPGDSEMLKPLSGILIDHFDSSVLSDDQKNALAEYVSSGGTLLIGTGEEGEKTLSGLGDLFGLKDGKKKKEVLDFFGAVSSASRVNLVQDRAALSKDAGWRRIAAPCARTGYERDLGEGKVLYTPYSLCDKSFSSWSNASDAGAGLISYMTDRAELPDMNDRSLLKTWYLERSLYAFMSSPGPDTFYYGIFFLIYIAALIIIGYYLLRHIQRREWLWIIVPLMSAAFTAFLVVRSNNLIRPDSDSFSMLKISENTKNSDEYYVLFQNGNGDASRIALTENVRSVEPFDYEYRLDIQNVPDVDGSKIDYVINKNPNRYEVLFPKSIPGTSRILSVSTAKKGEETLQADIGILPTAFYGTVSNKGKKAYSSVMAVRGRQFVMLGELQPGGRIDIDSGMIRCRSNYDDDPFSPVPAEDEGDEESVIDNVLAYAEKRWLNDTDRLNRTSIIGISYDSDEDIFAAGDDLKNKVSVDVIHIPDAAAGQGRPEEAGKTGSGSDENVSVITNINRYCLRSDEDGLLVRDTLEANKTKATYQFDRDKIVRRLYRNRDSFEGTVLAYNYRNGKDEVILKDWDDLLEQKDLEAFLSDQNVMILTYRLPKGEALGNTPVLSVEMAEPKDGTRGTEPKDGTRGTEPKDGIQGTEAKE